MRAAILLLIVSLTVACKGLNTGDLIGGAYALEKTITQTILAECGNTVPGGPCKPGSLISTEDKDSAKLKLTEANGWIDEANVLHYAGKPGAGTLLERATNVLNELEMFLLERGVE